MRYKQLGNTGLFVSELCLGTMTFGPPVQTGLYHAIAGMEQATANGIADRRGYARFESVQAYYSIAGRDIERELAPMLTEEKVGLLAWSPLAGGLLSGKFSPGSAGQGRRERFDFPPVDRDKAWACVATMRAIAEKHSANVASVALAYLLAKPFVTSVVIGAKRPDQLEQNLGAVNLVLDADDLSRLDSVSSLTPEYPGWMLERTAPTRMPAGVQVTPGAPASVGPREVS